MKIPPIASGAIVAFAFVGSVPRGSLAVEIGQEVAVPKHLQDGEEYQLSTQALLAHGRALFTAAWTVQEGGGRPSVKMA